MERLKISEAIEAHEKRTGEKIDRAAFYDHVFPDTELGKGRMGDQPLSKARKRTLITYWDNGQHLTRCNPRHIVRIAEYFGITLIRDIVQVTKPKTRRKA